MRLRLARIVREWELLHEPGWRGVHRLLRERPALLWHGRFASGVRAVYRWDPRVWRWRLRLHARRWERYVHGLVVRVLRRGRLHALHVFLAVPRELPV